MPDAEHSGAGQHQPSEAIAKTKTTTSKDSRERIARQLEQSILDDCEAVTNGDFGPDSPLFKAKAPYWKAEVTAALGLKDLTCQEFVEAVTRVKAGSPDYTVRPIDFTTTVNEKTGRAEIFANVETSGLWPGVTQRNVTICEYHRIDGTWYHVAHRTIAGMDVNIPG